MSSMHPGGGAWRHIRSDRSVMDNRIEAKTLRRVLGFARPHRILISIFLFLTVIDAAMVVVMPLLGLFETPRRLPNSITEAVLEKNAASAKA